MFHSCIVETLSDVLLPFHEVGNTGQKIYALGRSSDYKISKILWYNVYAIYHKRRKECDDSLYLKIHCRISWNQAVLVPWGCDLNMSNTYKFVGMLLFYQMRCSVNSLPSCYCWWVKTVLRTIARWKAVRKPGSWPFLCWSYVKWSLLNLFLMVSKHLFLMVQGVYIKFIAQR